MRFINIDNIVCAMASAVVFVFMLDNLPGFNSALNKTLQGAKFETTKSTLEPCKTIAVQAIMKSLRTASDVENRPIFKTDQIVPNNLKWSAESMYNLGSVFDVSIPNVEKDSMEIREDYFNTKLKSEEQSDCVDDVKAIGNDNVTNSFPESAPFLVAIFESLSNVTAQTCAGTLISPHWVLTAASCVNLLGHFYRNETSKSMYTIIVNATDSLTDGIAYNVTKVLLHPDYTHARRKRLTPIMVTVPNEKAHLALMRIEPGVEGAKDMVVDDVGAGGDARVYGLTLKNVTGNNSMHATSISVRTIPCDDEYRPVLCISNKITTDYSKLSSGGPILTIHNNEVRVLAVAQTDEHSIVGYPLYKHYKWIKHILEMK